MLRCAFMKSASEFVHVRDGCGEVSGVTDECGRMKRVNLMDKLLFKAGSVKSLIVQRCFMWSLLNDVRMSPVEHYPARVQTSE
jgi:hypothetical protein